ncbi:helix-turn-helix domain-containing protein [Corynebacterium mayonis]|uniref:helix-turn-helix domain-containing protein n=1 Tax=Corynebacterium mayonis TaxID=3062461 RepID=UPI003CC7F57E
MEATNSGNLAQKWLTPPEVAQLLPGNPTPETVRNWIKAGKLPGARRTPGNRWQIPESTVATLLGGGESS